MSAAIAHRLETLIREGTAFLTDVASENAAARARLLAALERERARLRADDALRLQTLIERRTGAK